MTYTPYVPGGMSASTLLASRKPKRQTTPPVGGGPKPGPVSDYDWAQALADRLLSPVTKQATDAINASSNARQAGITQATDELAKLMGRYDTSSYDQGIASQSALTQAFSDRLKNQGTSLSGDLSTSLAGIDPATAARVAGEVSAAGAGAGNASFATGAAGLGALVGDRAAAGDYKKQLPGIAGRYGLDATRSLQSETAQQIADAVTQIAGQRPNLVQQLASQRQTGKAQTSQQNFERALALLNATGEVTPEIAKLLGLPPGTKTVTKTKADNASVPHYDAAVSKSLGYRADQFGNPIGGTTTPLPGYTVGPSGVVTKTPAAKPPTPLSTSDRRNLTSDLNTWTGAGSPKKQFNTKTQTWMNVPGTGGKPLPYSQVVQNLMTSYGLTQQQAEQLADSKYQPGQHGRPYPVQPPKGTQPLSPNQVVDQRGGVYKLMNGKWVPQTSKAADYPPYQNG